MSRKHHRNSANEPCVWCKKSTPVHRMQKTWNGLVCDNCYNAFADGMRKQKKVKKPVVEETPKTKLCPHCGLEKPIEDFGKRKNHDSLKSWCKECHRQYSAERRSKRKAL